MVLGETIDAIRFLYGERLKDITVERLVVGVFFTGVKLSSGYGGISYTPVSALHGHTGKAPKPMSQKPFIFKGRPVSEILARDEKTPIFTTVTVTVLNALSEPFLNEGPYTLVEDRDALDIIDLESVKEAAMVGAIPPFLARLKKRPGIRIHVIEKKKESLRGADRGFYVPASRVREVLPFCDTVIITGASIANNTIDELLDSVSPEATVIITGPTASFLPDALFKKGVKLVSGVRVTSPDRALDMLQEGMTAYHLFDGCVRKLNVLNGAGGEKR